WNSPSWSEPIVERIFARSAGPALVCTSMSVPPMKSMPKFSPWKKYSAIAAIDSIADTGKLMRRKRMKSNFVSSGTMRRRRTARLSSGSFYVEHELLWNTKCFLQSSDRHDARTPQPHPIGDDQPG